MQQDSNPKSPIKDMKEYLPFHHNPCCPNSYRKVPRCWLKHSLTKTTPYAEGLEPEISDQGYEGVLTTPPQPVLYLPLHHNPCCPDLCREVPHWWLKRSLTKTTPYAKRLEPEISD
uniref:Uncharacterized protein n=1 Tax=Solanum tuberosum TaxID=4113 RepID=M1DRE5_SOLTU